MGSSLAATTTRHSLEQLHRLLYLIILCIFAFKLAIKIKELPYLRMSLSEAQSVGNLKPAFFMHLELTEPELVYDNAAETLQYVTVKSGYTKTLDPAYQFDTKLLHGFDNVRTSKAHPESMRLDCQIYLESKANGKQIHVVYTGVITNNAQQADVLIGKAKHHGYQNGYITNNPIIHLNSDAREEAWANSKSVVGRGQFIRDADNNLAIEYYVYVLE